MVSHKTDSLNLSPSVDGRKLMLCLLAHAFLTVTRLAACDEETGGKKGPLCRPYPTHRARGKTPGAGDDRA
jgi:hypothetical protein